MRRLAAVLALGLVGYPLLIAPTNVLLVIGALAMALCALGILFSTPVLVAGLVLALGEYSLALWLWGGPPRLAGAVLFGVGLVLVVEIADFARRARHAAIGPGVVASQLRYWGAFGALAGSATLAAVVIASMASPALRLPWGPAFAAVGAGIALVAVAIALASARPDADHERP